jgi:4-amino-4-deoxy-L-arabinose transferase-like glycosyltransferase
LTDADFGNAWTMVRQLRRTMDIINTHSHRRWLILALIIAAFIRLATLGVYPLTDNTEARYAEVAREMLVSGNWISPQLHGVKYWSKPPLSIWMTAGAMRLFGINEFAARLSPFLMSLLVVWLVYALAVRQQGKEHGLVAAFVLVSSALFFISSGAVMTDAALVAGTTLSMAAFWGAIKGSGKQGAVWGYLFFIGLSIGLLAKGPVGAVLTFLPIGLWVLWKNRWGVLWSRIPWVSGLLLLFALTLPWYIAAEARTPGFLNYFIIGEHWKRFTQPGWAGDLYGSAHNEPRGTIWLFWLVAAFPWSLVFLGSWMRKSARRRRIWSFFQSADDYTAYLFLWAVCPMLFFTFAGNILWTYVLPGLPAFALLLAQGWSLATTADTRETPSRRSPKARFIAGLSTPLIFILFLFIWSFAPSRNNQKYLVSRYLELRHNPASKLVYLYDRPFSAEFYSSGKAVQVTAPSRIDAICGDAVQDFFAVKQGQLPWFLKKSKKKMLRLGTYDGFILLAEPEEGKTHANSGGG